MRDYLQLTPAYRRFYRFTPLSIVSCLWSVRRTMRALVKAGL